MVPDAAVGWNYFRAFFLFLFFFLFTSSNGELVDSLMSYETRVWATNSAVLARIRQYNRVFPEALAFFTRR